MKKLLFLSMLIGNFVAFAAINSPWDFQVWCKALAASTVNKKSKLTVYSEYRFGNDASEFFYNQTRIQYLYKITPWLQLEPTYRQIYHKGIPPLSKKIEWFPEYNALFFGFTLLQNYGGYLLSDRNWTYLRMFPTNIRKNEWEYRNRFQVITPWIFSPLKIVPFFSNEVFFRERIGFAENRFMFGLTTPFNDSVDFLLAYTLRSLRVKGSGINNVDILSFILVCGF